MSVAEELGHFFLIDDFHHSNWPSSVATEFVRVARSRAGKTPIPPYIFFDICVDMGLPGTKIRQALKQVGSCIDWS